MELALHGTPTRGVATDILNGEVAVAHDDEAIDRDGANAGNDIHVDFCASISAGKLRAWIAQGLVVASVTGDPLPVLVEGGGDIAAFSGGNVDSPGIAHYIVYLVGDGEDFVIIGAHAFGHDLVIDSDHMAVPHVQFIHEEWQHGQAAGDFTRLGSGNVKDPVRLCVQ